MLNENLTNISSIEFNATDENVTAIKALTVTDPEGFNGESLAALETPIETLTFSATAGSSTVQTIENISNVGSLIIEADVADLKNIKAESVTISGTSQSIANIAAKNVTINGASDSITGITADNVEITNTSATVQGITAATASIFGAVESITGSTVTGTLNINTTATSLDLTGSTGEITANGSFGTITGAGGASLTIASTANNVVVNNVSSTQITIAEVTPFAQLLKNRVVASLGNSVLFASNQLGTTTMSVTFADGDYTGQTLTIERQDVKVDVQKNAFSKISIKNDGIDITAGTTLVNLFVSNNVSYLNLAANIENLNVDLAHPLTIHSSEAKTIANLNITAPTTGTDEWLDFINISATKIKLNGTSIDEDHSIFKKPAVPPAVTVPTFSSVLSPNPVAPKFGYHYITAEKAADETLHYVLVTEEQQLSDYINITTPPSGIQSYSGSKFLLYAGTKQVVVYKMKGGVITGYSLPNMPVPKNVAYLYEDSTEGKITYRTTFKDATSIGNAFNYFLLFQNGALTYQNFNLSGSWVKDTNGFNTYTFETGLNLGNTRNIYLTAHSVTGASTTVTEHTSEYIAALKKVAELSVSGGRNNPEMIRNLLEWIVSTSNTTFDSFFLSKYVEKLNASPGSYNTKAQLESLVETVNAENAYDVEATMSKGDLDLTGTLTNSFTYSTAGIVSNAITDTGELLFTGLNAGTTTVRVTDSNGKATLVHVEVDANKKVVIDNTKVLAVDATSGTLLEGSSHFRYSTDGTKLLPTLLEAKSAVIQSGTSESDEVGTLTRVRLEKSGTTYTLNPEETLSSLVYAPTDFGLDDVTKITSTHVGYLMTNGQVVLYPRSNGTETMMVENDTKKTAIYVTTNTSISPTIAKSSDALAITSALQLQSVTQASVYPATAAVHLYNDGSSVQVFANDAFKGAYTLTDNAAIPNVTILNVTAIKLAGKITVNSIELVKHSVETEDNSGASVQNISGTSVRAVGLDLFATGVGKSIVTLSNGKQYEVNVTISNNQYEIAATEVQTFALPAADLHMTSIKDIESANPLLTWHLIDSSSKVIMTLPTDTTTALPVTITSTNNEKAVIHLTKSGNVYSHDIDRTEVDAATLGFSALPIATSNALPAGLTPDIVPSYGKFDSDKLYIYNIAPGNRALRITDGTLSTVVNTKVSKTGERFTSTVTPVTHDITGFTIKADAEIVSPAARLVGTKLYATGLGLVDNKAKIEVPLANGAYYVIEVKMDPDTGIYNFNETATVTFTKQFNKAALGLDTLTTASVDGANTTASINGDIVTLAIAGDTAARVRVNGTRGADTTAASYIYVERTDADDKMEATVEKAATAIDLTTYGYSTSPTINWSRQGPARATISSDLKADIYSLDLGTTALELTDTNNKKLFINVSIANAPGDVDDKLRTVTTEVVEKPLHPSDTSITGTIIEGDAVRLSADKKSVYAVKKDATAKVRLSDNTLVQYAVEQDANGQYILTATPLTNSAVVDAATLGLAGNLSATGLNAAIASATSFEDTITVTGNTDGKTSMIVTDAANKAVAVNVTVDSAEATPVEISAPITTTATEAPILIHEADASIVRLDGKTIYALATGTASLLVGNEIQQVTVSKVDGHYAITAPTTISKAVFTPTALGFDAATAMTINAPATGDFYIAQKAGKVIAYSKLTGTTTSNIEFTVQATDGSNLSTLIRLKDLGTALLDSKIAVQDETFAPATSVTIADAAKVRFDQANGKLYTLAAGYTYATVDGRLQAIDLQRDADGYLKAEIRPLSLTSTSAAFTAITATDATIVDIVGNKIYPKKLGQTTVKDGNDVVTIKIAADEDGKFVMTSSTVTSQFVSVADAGLAKFTDAKIVAGSTSAISLSRDENTGLTIYSKDAQNAQVVRVEVTDGTNKAMINVTLDENGAVASAVVPKIELDNLKITLTDPKTVQVIGARGVWENNKLTIYPLAAGNTALAFKNGLVNITTTAEDIKLNNPTATILAHGLTAINTITNSTMVNDFYPTAIGTALVHAAGKVHSISVTKPAEHYVMNVSDGVPFATLDLSTAGGTYAVDNSTLVGTKAIIDEDETNKLIIYADGTGVSDIAITVGGNTHIYHTTATSSAVSTPVLAKTTLAGNMVGATVLSGTSTQLIGNDLYHQAVGTTALLATEAAVQDRIINATVSRDANGYLTTTPSFVSATLKETATISSTNLAIDGTTIYALNGVTEEKFYTDNYRVVAKTTVTNHQYALSLDERHMKTFAASDYGFQPSDTIVLKDGGNTNSGVASFEMKDNDIVIYAGDIAASTTITVTNGIKELAFNVTRGSDGKITVTPQASLESLKFVDMELTNTASTMMALDYDASVIDVTTTTTGLNITAKKAGTTAITLKQDGNIVGLVNVKVETVGGNLQVTSTPVTYTATNETLHTTGAARQGTIDDTKYYATAIGNTLYEVDDTKAIFVTVTKNADTGLYTATPTAYTLAALKADQLDLTSIQSATSASTAVNTVINTAQDTVFLYGVHEGIPDITISDGTNYAKVVANSGTALQTTIASTSITDASLAGLTWTSSAPSVATVRGGKIYTQESGKTTLKATTTDGVTSYDVFMNVSVTRNENRTFAINPEVIRTELVAAAEVLSGESVFAVGQMIYAQKPGISTVQAGSNIYTVNVIETADGLLKLEVSEPVIQQIFTAEKLGHTTLETPVVNTITGSGVVTAQISNNTLIVYAKNTGQAEVTVNGGQTVIHILVTEENGKLKIKDSIAKTTIPGATDGSIISTVQGDSIAFRYNKAEVYALKEGKAVASVDGKLYNVVATKIDNILTPTASRIEHIFTGATTVTDDPAKDFVTTDGKTIIATGFGTEDVTVDDKIYRVTVETDGSMKVVLLATSTIDLAGILSTITSTNSSLVETTYSGTTVTAQAKGNAGSEIIEVSDGTNTIQLKVTVTENASSFDVTSLEIVSETYNLAQLGLYANRITKVDGTTAFSSPHGLIHVSNGTLTVYPGTTGEVHFIAYDIDDKQRLFKLVSNTANPEASFSFAPLTQTIEYNAFGFEPLLMNESNALKVEKDGTGLKLTFHDTAKKIFVVRSESLYKTVVVKATANNVTNTFDLDVPIIQDAHVVTGEVSNVKGNLKTVTHNTNTVIYADQDTSATASYTVNGQIYNVTVNDYVLTATALEKLTAYTSASLVQGTDIVSLVGDKWVAKAEGTGIYKTNTNDYVKVHVTLNGTSYEITEDAPLAKLDLTTKDSTITAATILAPTTGVYTDGTIVYGETAEKVVVSTDSPAGKALYSAATIADLAMLQEDALATLGWTDYTDSTLSASSNVVRLEKTTGPVAAKFIPIGVGKEIIKFTSASGLTQEVEFTVNADYTVSIVNAANVITYTSTYATSQTDNMFTFSFNLTNLNATSPTAGTSLNNKILIEETIGTPVTHTFTIELPELTVESQTFDTRLNSIYDFSIISGDENIIQYIQLPN